MFDDREMIEKLGKKIRLLKYEIIRLRRSGKDVNLKLEFQSRHLSECLKNLYPNP